MNPLIYLFHMKNEVIIYIFKIQARIQYSIHATFNKLTCKLMQAILEIIITKYCLQTTINRKHNKISPGICIVHNALIYI